MVNMKHLLLFLRRHFKLSSYLILIFAFWLTNLTEAKSKLSNYHSILCADNHCKGIVLNIDCYFIIFF